MGRELIETWVIPFVTILFVVDPLAVIPAFLAMTTNDGPEQRRLAARKAALASFLILAGFGLAGGALFKVFGVTLPAFRVAGGIILGLSALEMLRADMPTRGTREEIKEGVEKADVAITPLAMPLLAGPGAISTVMVLTHRAPTWMEAVPVYLSLAVTGLLTLVLLTVSERLHRLLGRTGINVLGRIMGLVLATLAVQFILDGLRDSGLLQR
jgi:multiple antibiotic resistance protein